MRRIRSYDEFRRRWKSLAGEVLSRPVFDDVSEKAKADRRARCKDDVLLFARTYFPEYVRDGFAKFHREWPELAALVDEPILVEAFRGAGKSTFFVFLELIHRICYARSRYIVVGSYVVEKAAIFTARIRLELAYNPKLRADFGDFFGEFGMRKGLKLFDARIPGSEQLCRVQAVSIGQDPRGLVFGAYRPDTVRLDDIQSSKRARSKRFVAATVDWIYTDLVPALERGFSLVICATPLNNRCVASTLEKGDAFTPAIEARKYSAKAKNGRPSWPDRFPKERLDQLLRVMGPRRFAQEMELKPISLDEAVFKEESILWYGLDEIAGRGFSACISWTDPAAKKGDTACYKATVCLLAIEGTIYVVACRIRRESINAMIDGMYAIDDEWHPWVMYYENVGGFAVLEDTFALKARERGRYIPVQGEGNSADKLGRIEGTLSALLENGVIRFRKDDPDQVLLVQQLLEFPDGDLDGPDALEGAVRKIQEYLRRRSPPAVKRVDRRSRVLEGYGDDV